MSKATDQQVQTYTDARVRPRAEQLRALLLAMEDDKAAIDAVYAHCADGPTWADNREDGPPTLLTADDLLAYNTFLTDVIAAIRGNAQLATVLKACVRPVRVER